MAYRCKCLSGRQSLSAKVMSFVAAANTAGGEKMGSFGPTSPSFDLSILTFLSSEKAKTLPHTPRRKKSYFSRVLQSKTDKLSIQYKDDRCQNFLSLERQNIIKCIQSARLERAAAWQFPRDNSLPFPC